MTPMTKVPWLESFAIFDIQDPQLSMTKSEYRFRERIERIHPYAAYSLYAQSNALRKKFNDKVGYGSAALVRMFLSTVDSRYSLYAHSTIPFKYLACTGSIDMDGRASPSTWRDVRYLQEYSVDNVEQG